MRTMETELSKSNGSVRILIYKMCPVLLMVAASGLAAWGQSQQSRARPPQSGAPKAGLYQRPSGAQPNQQKRDFFDFATKQVNSRDFDWGGWIEERRQAFLEASVANPFFWYSALSTVLLILLMSAYSVHVLGEKRKLWRAAEILTDVWNESEQMRIRAREAIDKHNRHMQDCNRVVEAQISGRPSAAALDAADANKELERLRRELNESESARKRLDARVNEKERLADELSARVAALEKTTQNGGSIPSQGAAVGNGHGESEARLIARINQLSQQLEMEKQKNRALKGA